MRIIIMYFVFPFFLFSPSFIGTDRGVQRYFVFSPRPRLCQRGDSGGTFVILPNPEGGEPGQYCHIQKAVSLGSIAKSGRR